MIRQLPDEDRNTLRNILDMMGMKRAEQAPYTDLYATMVPQSADAAPEKSTNIAVNTANTAVAVAKSASTAVKSGFISVKRKANVDRLLRRFKDKKDDKDPTPAPK